jgi:H+/Cl- antiporter ClcA
MTPAKTVNEPAKEAIHEYADGWITERSGTEVPTFLKFAFIAIAAGAIAYFFTYMYGEVNHPDRGVLVRAMNAATQTSAALMYCIAALIVVYGVIVVAFSFRRSK